MNVPPEVSRAVEAREKIVEALALQDSVRLRMVVKSAAQTLWSNQSLAASSLPVVFRDPVLAHQLDGATEVAVGLLRFPPLVRPSFRRPDGHDLPSAGVRVGGVASLRRQRPAGGPH